MTGSLAIDSAVALLFALMAFRTFRSGSNMDYLLGALVCRSAAVAVEQLPPVGVLPVVGDGVDLFVKSGDYRGEAYQLYSKAFN